MLYVNIINSSINLNLANYLTNRNSATAGEVWMCPDVFPMREGAEQECFDTAVTVTLHFQDDAVAFQTHTIFSKVLPLECGNNSWLWQ